MKPNPRCPQCHGELLPVTQEPESFLSPDQFASVRAGDWYCTTCESERAQTGFKYFWTSELPEEITEEEALIRARSKLEAKRREDGPGERPIVSIEHHCAEALKRILAHPNAPDREVAARERESKVAALRERWDAPARHANNPGVRFDGQWGLQFETLKLILGTGFLHALVGTRGTGKTQLAVELMRSQTGTRLLPARFTDAVGFFMALKETFDGGSRRESQVLAQFTRPDLLIIDEVHERGESPWEDRLLSTLINRRYNAEKDTILIANLTPQEFTTAMGPSVARRLAETGGMILCDWTPFRRTL